MGLINAWKGLFTTKNVYQKRQNLQRIYKAATVDRTTLDWMVSQTSPDQEWKNGIKNLRNRVHDVVCLLYTSPSPRDRIASRMPSSA